MSIKMDWASVLGQGVLGGIAGYADSEAAQAKEARENDEKEKLAKLHDDAERSLETLRQAIAPPRREVVQDTDANGKPITRTVQSKFTPDASNPAGGSWIDTTLGSQAVIPKAPEVRNILDGPNEISQERQPDGTWKALGAPSPRFNPADATMAAITASDARQLRGFAEAEKNRATEAQQTNGRMAAAEARKDFDAYQAQLNDAGSDAPKLQSKMLQKYGIDPAAVNADDLIRQGMVNDYMTQLGAAPATGVAPKYDPDAALTVARPGGTTSTPVQTRQPPSGPTPEAPGSASNPIKFQPGMPKPPSGTHVIRPDGQVVVVP